MSANKFLTMIAVFIYLSPWLRCLTLQRISGNSPVPGPVPVSVLVLPYRCPTSRLQCAQIQYQTTVPGTSDNAISKILPVQVPYVSQNHFVSNLKRLKISHESFFFFFSKPRLFFQTELLENRVTFFSSKSVKSVP